MQFKLCLAKVKFFKIKSELLLINKMLKLPFVSLYKGIKFIIDSFFNNSKLVLFSVKFIL